MQGERAMQIQRLDHLVLTVRDIEVTCDFYQRVLGVEIISFGDQRTALRFGDQKINLHRRGAEIEPCAAVPTPGSADLCFIARTPVEEMIERLDEMAVEIEHGPVTRTGACGQIRSIYIRDPDNNLLELSNYL
jgi:catechol 2,3-dioxygenase-like lactoylglutathione lyase family enzyme